MLSSKNRLATPTEFYNVKKFGKKLSNSFFTIIVYIDRKSPEIKFGFVISKKILSKASDRNKVKRISRALTRDYLKEFPAGTKALIFPKASLLKSNSTQITYEYKKLIESIK